MCSINATISLSFASWAIHRGDAALASAALMVVEGALLLSTSGREADAARALGLVDEPQNEEAVRRLIKIMES